MGVRRALLANKSRKKEDLLSHTGASLPLYCCCYSWSWCCSSSFFAIISNNSPRRVLLSRRLQAAQCIICPQKCFTAFQALISFQCQKYVVERQVRQSIWLPPHRRTANLSFHKSCHNSFSICSVTPQYFDTS